MSKGLAPPSIEKSQWPPARPGRTVVPVRGAGWAGNFCKNSCFFLESASASEDPSGNLVSKKSGQCGAPFCQAMICKEGADCASFSSKGRLCGGDPGMASHPWYTISRSAFWFFLNCSWLQNPMYRIDLPLPSQALWTQARPNSQYVFGSTSTKRTRSSSANSTPESKPSIMAKWHGIPFCSQRMAGPGLELSSYWIKSVTLIKGQGPAVPAATAFEDLNGDSW
mmetsp:Transcript_30177/g.65050  ORF Transcript_30177/g.65050 Transcript_30177/m.65050 type:complete len:224 (+) Transcript_30177:814-1485(+)